MKKIPTIFLRDPDNMSSVLGDPNPVCDWVFRGEGVATRKYDGTCCAILLGRFFKRRTVKKGKSIPWGFSTVDHDENTGKRVGWVPVGAEDIYHLEALGALKDKQDGTYELIGPKIQGNPEEALEHELVKHGMYTFPDAPEKPSYENMRLWFDKPVVGLIDIEGLVFHHPDGRMAKIKLRDFGLKRK